MIGSNFLKKFSGKNEDMPPAGISSSCREKSLIGRRILTPQQVNQQSQLRTSSTGILSCVEAKVSHRAPSTFRNLSHFEGAAAVLTQVPIIKVTRRYATPEAVRPAIPRPEGIRRIQSCSPLRKLSELGPDPDYIKERQVPPVMIKKPLKVGVRMVPDPVCKGHYRPITPMVIPAKRSISPEYFQHRPSSKRYNRYNSNNTSQIRSYTSIHANRQRGIYCCRSPYLDYDIHT
eukprot:Tbor_TRINITY_DN3691_c0_g1::TRINITY_DN3691_c0_g1_i1::g.398::m.398